MRIKESQEVFKSFNYDTLYKIILNEDYIDTLLELTNPNRHDKLFGAIRANNSKKQPNDKARPNVQISYFENKINNKFAVIRNQLSLSIIYMCILNAVKINNDSFELTLNSLLIAELEYSISHDVLRKSQEIKNINNELEEEDLSENYINECRENIKELNSTINKYTDILTKVVDKTIGKDGIHLIRADMNKNELEGLNSLKLHMEMCRKGMVE